MLKKLHQEALKLLKEKRVDVIIGYELTPDGKSTTPCFIEKEEDVPRLIWNEHCFYNLSNYLPEIKGKVGIVAKGCDVKSIVGLLQERQIKREDVIIIGMECKGQRDEEDGEIFDKCKSCQVQIPKLYDILIEAPKSESQIRQQETNPYAIVEEMETKTLEERWEYWQKQFERCIKCYACRQICPLCYCQECITDRNIPQWILPSPSFKGNAVWNIVRAFHLAGRCIDCGECERACPMNIPLRKINKKLEKEIKELFGYEAGLDPESKPPLADFKPEDPEEFIK